MSGASLSPVNGPSTPLGSSQRSASAVPYYPWAFYSQQQPHQKDYQSSLPPNVPPTGLSALSSSPHPMAYPSRYGDSRGSVPPSTHLHHYSGATGPLTSAPTPMSPGLAASPLVARHKRFMEFSDFSAPSADKDSHTTKEKRRRQSVNAHYTELRAMLPPISENKAAVLHHALEHVRRMSHSCSAIIDQNNLLAERNQLLQAQIIELQELLSKPPSAAAGLAQGSSSSSSTSISSSFGTSARTSPSAASPYAPPASNDGRRRLIDASGS